MWKVHAYTHEYIRFADAKAAIALTWVAGVVATLATYDVPEKLTSLPTVPGLVGFTLLAGIGALLVAIVFGACVVFPRLSSGTEPGLIFWESIGSYGSKDRFESAIKASSVDSLERELSGHLWTISPLARAKFANTRLCIIFAVVGTIVISLFFLELQWFRAGSRESGIEKRASTPDTNKGTMPDR